MKKVLLGVLALVCLAAPRVAVANDVWDLSQGGPGSDDGSFTDNELANGAEQTHDLQAHAGPLADEDWYLVGQKPFSSYEVAVDGLTEEVSSIPAGTSGQALQVDLVDSTGTTITSGYAASAIGSARTVRFRNTTATEIDNNYVRIRTGTSGGCTTSCTNLSQYRVRFFDTTMFASRFNNNSTQITILIVQNSSDASVAGTARFWNLGGTLLASQAFSLAAHGTFVINTTTIAGLPGQSGSITIDHTGRYGSLTGKAVAVEPASGFTFDTLLVPKFN